MTARLLMIALDGADSNLIDRWSLDGTLPNIGALRARGTAHHLEAPHGVTDDALWASFQYAQGLGEHGRFNYMQRRHGRGPVQMAFLDEGGRQRFWDRISSSGKRVAIIDVPKVPPPGPLNGIHLADWLVHGRYSVEPRSYPGALAAEIVGLFGERPPSRCDYVVDSAPAARRELAAYLLASADLKRRAGLHYLRREAWDLFVIGLKEMHCAGHNFWDLVDPSHPGFNAPLRDELGDPVRSVFKAVDAAVGDLIAAAGADARVIVLSTTKMEPNASIAHLHKPLSAALNLALAESSRRRKLRQKLRLRGPVEIMPYSENGTAIRINRPTRRGRVRLQEAVEGAMRGLTDAATGEPLVEQIYHPSADERGRRAGWLPDLLIRYRAGHVPRAIASPLFGTIAGEPPNYRPGNHACGPFVLGTERDSEGIDRLEDFGPAAERIVMRG